MDIQMKGRNMHRVIAHALLLLMLWLGGAAYAGTVTYVYTDAQGTPLAEADASGNIMARFDYTPYGVSVPSMGPAPNGPGYTGHVNDPDTGLVYMQARYYDPAVGRFLSVDPLGPIDESMSHFNRYTYSNNNPIVNIDPDGRKVVVAGTGEFKREIKKQMSELRSTPTGRSLLRSLEESPRIFAVTENKGSSNATPDNPTNAGNHIGSSGEIKHDPNATPIVNTPDGPKATPPAVVLGHELVHAADFDDGTLDKTVNPDTGTKRSEEKAVHEENKIRGEMELPKRSGY